MAQTALNFDHHPADADTGFSLGWDHALFGLVPPAEHMHAGDPVRLGWQAGRRCLGRRARRVVSHTREWLQLRLSAWLHGQRFDALHVTPNLLRQLDTDHCPVTRRPLRAEGVVQRARDDAAFAPGNLLRLHPQAAAATPGLDWAAAWSRSQTEQPGAMLQPSEWSRLAVLKSFVTVLPHEQACALPLLVLPPKRVRVLNPVQGLQTLLTLELSRPDGFKRLQRLAEQLPDASARHNFNRFVSALLPRVIEATHASDAQAARWALEDAWTDPLVMKRWLHLAMPLGESRAESLLRKGIDAADAGQHMLWLPRESATEGWDLGTAGRVDASIPAPRESPARAVAPRLPNALRSRASNLQARPLPH